MAENLIGQLFEKAGEYCKSCSSQHRSDERQVARKGVVWCLENINERGSPEYKALAVIALDVCSGCNSSSPEIDKMLDSPIIY